VGAAYAGLANVVGTDISIIAIHLSAIGAIAEVTTLPHGAKITIIAGH